MSLRSSHTHCQFAQVFPRPKLVKECACPNVLKNSAAKWIDNEINKQKSPVPNKRSYAIGVLVVYQTFQLASRFVMGDTDAAPKSPLRRIPPTVSTKLRKPAT